MTTPAFWKLLSGQLARERREEEAKAAALAKALGENSHLGCRIWLVDPVTGLLRSPWMGTLWDDSELFAHRFADECDGVRGEPGIHARLYYPEWLTPDSDWRLSADIASLSVSRYVNFSGHNVVVRGIVERFGRYVLGEEGWRAEHVVIRKLQASGKLAADLYKHYPTVEIVGREGDKAVVYRPPSWIT